METRRVEKDGSVYLECVADDRPLSVEQDALDLVGACMGEGVQRVLLPAACLSDKFFDLKSRLAGEILLKLANYRIRTAAVIPAERISGRFAEFVMETNRGAQFRVFETRQAAEEWLLS